MDGYDGGCGISCVNVTREKASPVASITSNGPTPSLPSRGSSACKQPMPKHASPLAGNTINRRAGCGRSARPVRREGESKPIGSPYPYQSDMLGLVGLALDSRLRGNERNML